MSVQAELRRASKALAAQPSQAVLACLGILGKHPKNGPARRMLAGMTGPQRNAVLADANTLMAAGHWAEALALLTPLGQAHPADAALAVAETRCLFNLRRFAEILGRLGTPLRHHPDHPGLVATQGIALYRLGEATSAYPLLQKAAAAQSNDPHIANHLGLVARALGDLGAAQDSFRRSALAGLVEAWPNLAPMVDFRTDPALLPALEAALAGAKTPLHQEYLGFARAKAAFDLGDAETAFDWLARANALHRTQHPHNSAEYRRQVEALADRRPDAAGAAPRARRVILVVGMPRSGTTLLEQILAAHPAVEGLGECAALAQEIAALDHPEAWSVDDRDTLARRYTEALIAKQRTEAQVVVDKMPKNALFAGFALAALPDAHVVHIHRDPVATGLSILRTRFTEGNAFAYDMADIAARQHLTDACMARWAEAFPARVTQVSLEALIAAPEPEIGGLLAKLDLPPDPACLAFAGASGDVRTASAHQVRGPIAPQPTADWQPYAAHLAPLIAALKAEAGPTPNA